MAGLMKKTSKLFLVCLLLISLSSVYFFRRSQENRADHVKVVEVIPVERQTIRETAEVIGTIRSHKQTILTAKANGIITLNARSGQRVKKGELLAYIDDGDLERNYHILKETEEIARIQYDRLQSLLKTGVTSKNAAEEKKAALLETQKKLSDAKMALEELKLYAPFDGILGFFKLRDGSQVGKGDMIVNFYDPHSLFVEFDLPLNIATQVKDGSPVWCHQTPYQLTHIQKLLDEDTHMCPAYVNIKCPQCIIGTTLDVIVATQEKSNVIVIPFEAVFLRNAKPHVYVVKDNKSMLTPVTLGLRNKSQVEISEGLQEGEKLIVFGHARLYPYAPVKVHDEVGA